MSEVSNNGNECYKYEMTYESDDFAFNIGIENNAEECQSHCQNITGCNYFAYETGPKRCHLKMSNTDKKYSQDTIAGPKYCGMFLHFHDSVIKSL